MASAIPGYLCNIDLSFMAWEPCILKQPKGYNDPYEVERTIHHPEPSKLKRKRVAVYLHDIITGETKRYASYLEASKAIKARPSNIREAVINKVKVQKRYICYL